MIGVYRDSGGNLREVRHPTKKDIIPKVNKKDGAVFFMKCLDCSFPSEWNVVTEAYLRLVIDTKCFTPI